MTDRQRVDLQPGFVLHRRLYRETSLIVEVFSRDYGRLALVAKGVRGRRARAGTAPLQPFSLLSFSWSGRSELQTLTGAEPVGSAPDLDATGLYCGLYLNELISRFLHRHDPHPALFDAYADTLRELAIGAGIERALRLFELCLLNEVGFGLQLDYEVDSGRPIERDKYYEYIVERGPVERAGPVAAAVDGATLIGLREGDLGERTILLRSKRLLRRVIAHHLGGRPLNSRALFASSQGRAERGI